MDVGGAGVEEGGAFVVWGRFLCRSALIFASTGFSTTASTNLVYTSATKRQSISPVLQQVDGQGHQELDLTKKRIGSATIERAKGNDDNQRKACASIHGHRRCS